jgi:branched chain amino acid efflux pump
MTPIDSAGADHGPLIAIAAMAAATYLMRAGGFWLMAHVPLTPRVRRMLAALPGSVIAATVLPIVAIGGPVAMLAVGTAGVVMLATRNDFLAVIAGMAIAALLRAGGL